MQSAFRKNSLNHEVSELGAFPYRAIAHLYVTFPDGTKALGTGALVGQNDLLTATHVIYSPEAGGWASDIRISLGADYNTRVYRYESPSLLDLGGVRWNAYGFPSTTFSDGSHDTLTFRESQSDVALIGLGKAVGDQLGYFGMAPGYNSFHAAYQIGYPQGSTGMMYGSVSVQHNGVYEIYQATAGGGNQLMGPGSSGGPLFVIENGTPTIIGVRSSGTETNAYWADIGYTYQQLMIAMRANDDLLPAWVATRTIVGTVGNDVFYASSSAEQVEGGAGRDVLVFASVRNHYSVVLDEQGASVRSRTSSADVDHLTSVERLSFSDGTLAIDVGAGEAAGGTYRLYQAAFDRQPDTVGFIYWIDKVDDGLTLREVARSFVDSNEFGARYGIQLSHDVLVTNYYLNVLDREPEPAGHAYWLAQMAAGLSDSDVLALFAESKENQIKVSAALNEGLWLS
ncbi:DUF4214 domain-containing protein [Pseudidiomarina sp.]|uniref:DUF4214 domain-containing protein n=1 Tax=Pseudidiomarina sp. TaxID=2081707 RepID=UPI003A98767D